MKNKLFVYLTLVILLVGFFLRFQNLKSPVADWHSWRQADTAAVARNFLRFGFDLLRPRYDDLSNIQTGKDNPLGLRMVEFPIYQFVAASVVKIFPLLPIEVSLRLVTIIESLATCTLLMLLTSKHLGKKVGLFTGLLYSILPYNVFYGRSILPDPTMVFLSILSIWSLDLYMSSNKRIHFVISMLGAASALLVKPVAGFLLLPLPVIFFSRFSISKTYWLKLVIYGVCTLFPLWWWRVWITQYPEGIPAYGWLFNGGNIRFKGAWFYWIFAERISKLIFGYWGVFFFGTGLFHVSKKESWIFRMLLLGSLLYLVIIARGNVQHDYYQILLMPALCIYAAKGIVHLLFQNSERLFWNAIPVIVLGLFTLGFSWYTVRTFYWINRPEIVEVGRIADSLIPKGAKVIAPYNGDTTFLYQTNRQGWPIGFDIDHKLSMGAQYYVTVSPTDSDTETKELANTYTVLVRTDKYAIIDLTRKKK